MHKILKKIFYFFHGILLFLLFLLLRPLPLNASSKLLGSIARSIGPKLGISKKAYNNLKNIMPDKSQKERTKIVKGMWENLGRVIGEYPHLKKLVIKKKNSRIFIKGKKNLLLIKKRKIPAIFFSAHLANWEVAPMTAIKNNIPVLTIFRKPNNPFVSLLLKFFRSNVPLTPKGTEGAKQLIRSLRKGISIGLIVDQKMNDGIEVPFFKKPAMTAPAVAQLALKIKTLVIPVQIERVKKTNFVVTFHNPLKINKNGKQKTVLEIMTEVNLLIEKWIRKRPEQWFWLHRRW